MTHEELEALAGTYAVGALDGDELNEFSEHLLTCWACRRTVIEFDEVYADGARGLPPVEPSASVKEKLLSRASGTGNVLPPDRAPESLRGRSAIALKLAAAAGLLMAVLAWQTAVQRAGVIETLSRERDQIQEKLERQAPAPENRLLALLEAPNVQVHQLGGQGPAPDAAGRVLWRESQIGLVASGLPPLPKGSVYQLWAIVGDEKRGVALFEVDPKGAVRSVRPLNAPIAKDVAAFALTVEPAGGKPQPTGAIHLLSRS